MKDFFKNFRKNFNLSETPAVGKTGLFEMRLSFRYGERDFDPSLWDRDVKLIASDSEREEWQVSYISPDNLLLLKLKIILFKDFPVVEWIPELEGIGASATAVISDFRSLNLVCTTNGAVKIRRSLGSKSMVDDFVERTCVMSPRYPLNRMTMDTTEEGRPSSAWLPFFSIDFDELNGLNVGIGWSGGWTADFALEKKQLFVKSGMGQTHFRLFTGEKIRQPSIFVMQRDNCSVRDGQNLHRRFILKHHSPRDAAGKIFKTPVSFLTWGGMSTEQLLERVAVIREHKLPYDIFWIDAGWYGPDDEKGTDFSTFAWYRNVGNWRVNRAIHPEGLKKVTDAAHEAGMKALFWIEIERAYQGSALLQEHPDYFLADKINYNSSYLLNLGNEAACDYAIDTVSRLITENGFDHYRVDFNLNPALHWKSNDALDRQGISEAKYITGLYRFWDTLRKRFPDMLIDNCASGGRRIDFESMSRSICLWRSDVQCVPGFDSSPNQLEVRFLSDWVPLHAGGIWVKDDYDFFSAVASGVTSCLMAFESTKLPEDYDFEGHRKLLMHAKRMGELFLGDFYPLTEYSENFEKCCAFQCHDSERQTGFFLTFRSSQAEMESCPLRLNGIVESALYEIEDEKGDKKKCRGAELQNFVLSLPKRSCKLYYYTRLQETVTKK